MAIDTETFPDEMSLPADAPPGPTGVAGGAVLAKLARDPWFTPLELTKKYGDVVSIPTPFVKTVYMSHPDLIEHVLVKHPDRYRRSDMVSEQMVPPGFGGHNFFAFSDDEEWRRGRSLYRPHFTQRHLAGLSDLFTESVESQVREWGSIRETFDLAERTRELALVVLFNAVFDEYISERVLQQTEPIARSIMLGTTARVAMYSLPSWVPRPFQKSTRRGISSMLAVADHVIETRRRHPTDRPDVLNLLIGATYDDGRPLENDKIAVELMGLVVGGHETTAAALAWTFALVAGHPDIERRVVEEVEALGDGSIGVGDMPKLPLVRACFDEAQRLQGGLVINPKTAVVDDELGGYLIRKGTTVLYSSLAMQRDPRFWTEPNEFRPDRFIDGEADMRAFIPFGRGKRVCLGMQMAYIEAVLTIATAFREYKFSIPPGYRPRHQYRMSMGLKGGLPVTVTPRHPPGWGL